MPRRRGITLIELVITLAIVAVLSVMVVPGLGRWVREYRMKRVVRQIVSRMELAKIMALKSNLEHRIAFDPGGGTFQIESRPNPSGDWTLDGRVFQVPHQVPFQVNVSAIKFNPHGTATSGRVTIGPAQGKHYEITVNTTTGKINTKRVH